MTLAGSGASTGGGAAPGNFDLLASDAVAAFVRVRKEPGFDPEQVGFLGPSQGGWLSLVAAKKEQRAAFAIAVLAPLAGADVQMNFAVANFLRIEGQPQIVVDSTIHTRKTVDDYVRGQGSRAGAEAAESGIREEPWYSRTGSRGTSTIPNGASRSRRIRISDRQAPSCRYSLSLDKRTRAFK
jgi:hypothetical protein